MLTTGEKRGCGLRKEGGLYACTGFSEHGITVEGFILDPAIPYTDGPFRGVRMIQRPDGIFDMLLWVGKEHYPYVSDFVEEGRRHGFSKRIPINGAENNYENITVGSSRMLLVHPNCIINTNYELQQRPPEQGVRPAIKRPDPLTMSTCTHNVHYQQESGLPPCTFANWDLSTDRDSNKIDCGDGTVQISTVSAQYRAFKPVKSSRDYLSKADAGIFLAIPLTHFEYISSGDSIPSNIASKMGNNVAATAICKK